MLAVKTCDSDDDALRVRVRVRVLLCYYCCNIMVKQ